MFERVVADAIASVAASPITAGSPYRLVYLVTRGMLRDALSLGHAEARIREDLDAAWAGLGFDELDRDVKERAIADELGGITIHV